MSIYSKAVVGTTPGMGTSPEPTSMVDCRSKLRLQPCTRCFTSFYPHLVSVAVSLGIMAFTHLVFSQNIDGIEDLLLKSIRDNEKKLDPLYVETSYDINQITYGKITKEYLVYVLSSQPELFRHRSNKFSDVRRDGGEVRVKPKRLEIPEEIEITQTSVKLNSYNSKFRFHMVDVINKVVKNSYEVVFDGKRTREVHYRPAISVDEAMAQKIPFFDIMQKGQSAILLEQQRPAGFLLMSLGFKDRISDCLAKRFKNPNSVEIKWIPDENQKQFISMHFEDPPTKTNTNLLTNIELTISPENYFSPISCIRTPRSGRSAQETRITYSTYSVNGVSFQFPKEIISELFYVDNKGRKLMQRRMLIVNKAAFSENPPKDVFNIESLPEPPEK